MSSAKCLNCVRRCQCIRGGFFQAVGSPCFGSEWHIQGVMLLWSQSLFLQLVTTSRFLEIYQPREFIDYYTIASCKCKGPCAIYVHRVAMKTYDGGSVKVLNGGRLLSMGP